MSAQNIEIEPGQIWEIKDKREAGRRIRIDGLSAFCAATGAFRGERRWVCVAESGRDAVGVDGNARRYMRVTVLGEHTLRARWRLVEARP